MGWEVSLTALDGRRRVNFSLLDSGDGGSGKLTDPLSVRGFTTRHDTRETDCECVCVWLGTHVE